MEEAEVPAKGKILAISLRITIEEHRNGENNLCEGRRNFQWSVLSSDRAN